MVSTVNYKTIVEEVADRAVRHRKDLRKEVRSFCGRLLASGRMKDTGLMGIFPDGSMLDWWRLSSAHEIKWL